MLLEGFLFGKILNMYVKKTWIHLFDYDSNQMVVEKDIIENYIQCQNLIQVYEAF